MKRIPLSNGDYAIVDNRDLSTVAPFRWYGVSSPQSRTLYANATIGGRTVKMHRLILGTNLHVDHKNGDGLDNRRRNLRPATHSQNMKNQRLRLDNSSGFKGVYFNRPTCKWGAQIWSDGKHYWLGLHITRELAARAYNRAAKKLHGKFARLNEV